MQPVKGGRKKLLKIVALGASAAAAVGCGGAVDSPPHVYGTTVDAAGTADTGLQVSDSMVMGKETVDAGPLGIATEDTGFAADDAEVGFLTGSATSDAGGGDTGAAEAGPMMGFAPGDAGEGGG
jgi:hypothetical protein